MIPNSSCSSASQLFSTSADSAFSPLVASDKLLTPNLVARHASLLFIDPTVEDYQSLIAGVTVGTEVHLLNPVQDAVTQITNTLLGRERIDSIHIVSHGQAGGLDFANRLFSLSDLPSYAEQLQSWKEALTDDADILLYGCNVAEGELGQAFVNILSQLTGADVAASDDLTGSANQGGNWTLEFSTGEIESRLAWQKQTIAHYSGVLNATRLSNLAFPTLGSDLYELTNVNSTLYFRANDGTNGYELWKSDGTAAGTVLVKDIVAGSGSSSPNNLTNVNGTLFFTAYDPTNGVELWKSDGTAAGTVLVKDITAGSSNGDPYNLTNINGTLYFGANDGTSGYELWKSDGTAAGTVLVKDIVAGSNSGEPYGLTNVNGTLYFRANDGTNGYELWKSDGTAAGTVLVKDIVAGSGSSSPNNLTNIDGTLFFTAYDDTNGYELWKSDGTAAGTVLVKDIWAGSNSGDPYILTNVNGTLYFRAYDPTNGYELWKSDGTAAGTVLVKDIRAGADSGDPSNLTNVNGTLYFRAYDPTNGYELWTSDGTAAGTVLVKDIRAGANSGDPYELTNVNGTLYFRANDGTNGNELWKSDGTAAGTTLVKDIYAGSNRGNPYNLTNVNGTLYFGANDSIRGIELWKSDGTAAGTVLVKDANTQETASPYNLTIAGTTSYFQGYDPATGYELWKSDGTAAGTILVKDINPGSNSTNVENLTNVNGTLYFTAYDPTNGYELWKSDGTAAGTVLVKDIVAGSNSAYPNNLTNVNGTLYFQAYDDTNGYELWKSDGTAAGTVQVKDIWAGSNGGNPNNLTNVNGTLYFQAYDPTNGYELWKSDGTAAGTVLVKDIWAGSNGGNPYNLTNVNGILYFTAYDPTNGYELWKSDGTAAGTVLVKDIWAGSNGGNPSNLTNVNGTLYFTAYDPTNGYELWKSDGTAAGTTLVKDIWAGSNSAYPELLTNVNGTLYFRANDPTNGVELWKSNGTAAGTVLVKDIVAGSNSGDPYYLTNVNGTLYFRANDGINGYELWKSDGTAVGTILFRDIRAGSNSSDPYDLVDFGGNRLLFFANDGVNGFELWIEQPNIGPSLTVAATPLSYTENDPATRIDPTATVADSDSADFDTGTLTVNFSANGSADDRLAIRNQGNGAGQIGVSGNTVSYGGTAIGTFTGGTGTTSLTITFNANATATAVTALLQNLTYANVSEVPSTAARTVQLVITDGDGGTSTAVTKTINVTAVDDTQFVVINTNDSGIGSLRQAILDANADTGTETIRFNIPGSGVQTINIAAALPTITESVILDGTTQTGFNGTPLVELNGTNAGNGVNGLTITAGNSTVRGLIINRFRGNGIELSSNGGNTIQGNYIGIDATGGTDQGNTNSGVYINNTANNNIGGVSSALRNIISGNDRSGVYITGTNATDNQIQGNFLGTNVSGNADVGNSSAGVEIESPNNLVGGTIIGGRNIISGNNLAGVRITGPTASGNQVLSNYIGTDVNGDLDIGSDFEGILISEAPNNVIGGTSAGAGNVISGNNRRGVWISGNAATNNTVQGNYIGTRATGFNGLGNSTGVYIDFGADANTIGGTSTAARNIISSSISHGVEISGTGTTNNLVQGNYIGTDAGGSLDLGNGGDGVRISSGSTNNTIGSTISGAGNVVAGNTGNGVHLQDAGTSGNLIQGNTIGTNAAGNAQLRNDGDGVRIDNNATNNTIGGSTFATRNLISGNFQNGIAIISGSTGNIVQGNAIGTNSGGTAAIANRNYGLFIAANNTTIGGSTPGTGNLISGNGLTGLYVTGNNSTIRGNLIGTDVAGNAAIANNGDGIIIFGTNNIIGGTNSFERNVISGNTDDGIHLAGGNNQILGNNIGTNTGGNSAIANGSDGIEVNNVGNNIIGSTVSGGGNLISGNTANGIYIAGSNATGNTVIGNRIGTRYDGTNALGNGGNGLLVELSASNNTIGGTSFGEGNAIAFNQGNGVAITQGTGNRIQSNAIFANTNLGIDLDTSGITGNDLGDADSGANNRQNFPILTNVSNNTISGFFNSTASRNYRIEFFANTAYDPSGAGEGEVYLGFQNITTDGSGNANISFNYTPVNGKPVITATATDLTTGNTSEFSLRNQAPVNNLPAGSFSTNEDTAVIFSGANKISISDPDTSSNLQVTLNATNGTVTLGSTSNVSVTGNNSASVTLTGSITNLNAALDGLSFAPALNYNGTAAIQIVTNDQAAVELGGALSDTDTLNITVTEVNDVPTGTNDSLSSIAEDSGVYTIPFANLLSNDSTGPANESSQSLTITNVGSAVGGTVSISGNNVLFTPTADFNGAASFQYTMQDNGTTNGATDPKTATAIASFTITPVNDNPTAVNDSLTVAEDSTTTSIAVLGNDTITPDTGETLTITAVGTPNNGGTIAINGSNIDYTPAANFNGTESFTYTISDGNGGTSTATVNVIVMPVNDNPTATNDSLTVAEDSTTTSIAVLSNDTITPDTGETLTITAVGTPSNGGTVAINGSNIDYTPAANFNGTESFTYTISDGNGGTSTATVNVTITPVNDNPTATNDTLTVAEDSTTTSIAVLGNDTITPDTGETLTITAVGTLSNGGTAIINGSNIDYTPAANFNGIETFTYTISDGNGGTSTATVNVTVTPVNDNPTATNDSLAVTEDSTTTSIAVLGNDTITPDTGETLAITTVGTPSNGGTAIINGSNIDYTPAANFNGTETFTYTISDGNGGTSTATVNVTVTPVNDNPTAINDSLTVAEDSATTSIAVLNNDTITPDTGETLTITAVGTPSNGGTVAINGSNINYTPAANFNGTESFTYTISDGNGGTSTATVNVTVTPVNDAPSFTVGANQTITSGSGAQTLTGWATGFIPGPANESGQAVLSYQIVSNDHPEIFAVAPAIDAAGKLTYTPVASIVSTVTATIGVVVQDNGGTANGGVNTSTTQFFTIAVKPQPTLSINSVTQNEGNSGTTAYNFTVSLSDTSTQTVQVNYAMVDGSATVADGDYANQSGALTFNPGETSKTITINGSGDTRFENTETFSVNLSGAVNSSLLTAQGTGTLTNDDTVPTVSISNPTISEGNSGTQILTFTVSLSQASGIAATVDYATADGTATVAGNDYTAATGTLTFAPGETRKTIAVTVKGDTLFETNETFSVNLSNPTQAAIATATGTGTITNDDAAPTLRINDISHSEGTRLDKPYSFTVSLSNASGAPVSVTYATADDTAAIADNDYTATNGILTFVPGETSKTVTVMVKGDRRLEDTEKFQVNLSNATGGTIADGIGVGTIGDDDGNEPDFNQDGKVDIFWHNRATSETVIWLMNGTTLASHSSLPLAHSSWRIEGTGDFNDDGVTDIFWHNTQTLETSLWLMNGNNFGTFKNYGAVSSNWHIAEIADFDGDSKEDIFWRNYATGENSIWLMNGTTFSTARILPTASPVWEVSAIGDFDGDNDADIFWHNTSTGENSIWQLNNASFGSFTNLVATGSTWHADATVDFDDDGDLDIFWRNYSTGENVVWTMNGITLKGFTNLTPVHPNWRLSAIADFNSDDRLDFFWRNYTTGENVVWTMNGTSITGTVPLPGADPNWLVL